MKISVREQEERKSRLIHCAFRLFCENGIEKITMREIAAAAEVSEKSVYRYFSTKVALLVTTADMLWQEIVLELTACVGEGYYEKSGYEQVHSLLDCFQGLFDHHANYILFSYEFKQYLIHHHGKLSVDEYSGVLHAIREVYIAALEKGMVDGSIAVHSNVDDLYFAVWGLMRGYAVKIAVYDQIYDGANVWRGSYEIAKGFILSGLKNGRLPAEGPS